MIKVYWQLRKHYYNRQGEQRYIIEFWRKVDRSDSLEVMVKALDKYTIREQIEIETGLRNFELENRNGR